MNIRHYKLFVVAASAAIALAAVSCDSKQTKSSAGTPEYEIMTLDTTSAVAYIE